jgi:hypothetical protein
LADVSELVDDAIVRGNDQQPPIHLKKLLDQTDNAGLQDHFGVNRKKI